MCNHVCVVSVFSRYSWTWSLTCNVRQSAPSRPPLRAIHDDLRYKAGMCLDSCPVLPSYVMDYVMERVSRKVGTQVGQLTFTDNDYADDIALLVDTQESFRTTLTAMDEEASKFGLQVSWTKTKLQNLGSRSMSLPIIVDGNTVDSVKEFTYLGSIESSFSNSGPEYIRRIRLVASAMKRLDCIWSQSKLNIATKLRIYSTCVLSILLYGFETWTLTQTDWKRLDFFHLRCQRRTCTSAGMISCLTMKFCVVLACSTSPTSSVFKDWVSLVTSPDFEVMYRLSLIHIWRCRRIERCRSRWSPYH